MAFPGNIPPAQLPLQIEVGQVTLGNGEVKPVLYVDHPLGVSVFILDPDLAINVGRAMERVGMAGKLLLTVPGSNPGPMVS